MKSLLSLLADGLPGLAAAGLYGFERRSTYRIPPLLLADEFPNEDPTKIRVINTNIVQMDAYCRDLRSAVALYWHLKPIWRAEEDRLQELDKQHKSSDASNVLMYAAWLGVAARDAATTIYKFDELLDGTTATLNECATVTQRLEPRLKRKSTKLLATLFPDRKGLRHSATHGNLFSKLAAHEENSLPSGSVISGISLKDDAMIATFRKKVVRLPITEGTAVGLGKVKDLYWDFLEPVNARRTNWRD